MGFFPEAAINHMQSVKRSFGSNKPTMTMQDIVGMFPPNLKQAIFAASVKPMKKGTWDGCVFNAAGSQVNENVRSSMKAAEVFGVSSTLVGKFIMMWDNSPEISTADLRHILIKVGLDTEPQAYKPSKAERKERHETVVFVETVFKGSASEFMEELASVDSLADIPGFTVEMEEAANILVGV